MFSGLSLLITYVRAYKLNLYSEKETVTKQQNADGQWVTTIKSETTDESGRIIRTSTRTITEERTTVLSSKTSSSSSSSTASSSLFGKFKAKFSHTDPVQKPVTTTIKPSLPTNKLPQTVAVASPSSASNSNQQQFENDCLKAHNEFRRKHNVPPLILDRSLCNYAQEWSNVSQKAAYFGCGTVILYTIF